MHEVVKRCGTLEVTEVLVSQIMKLDVPPEKLSELNLRLTVLILTIRDSVDVDMRWAFAQAATADLRSQGFTYAAAGGKR
jgi:hypothetical protein